MTVSIIIAVKSRQKNLEDCILKCSQLDFSDFEIIVLPDFPFDKNFNDPRVRVVPTGPVSPARKRDIALSHAQGRILAFIDDDAYPVKGWLTSAVENFQDADTSAVGGPAITPAEDNLLQHASGLVYSSVLVSGNFRYRYVPMKMRQIDDYPSCNLLVRKPVLEELGGFKTDFWPGEDTKLCLDITYKLGKKIIYDPRVLVYHHRRALFLPHLRQIASYALHRGYFVKKYPQTSLKISYFIPSLFVIGLTGGMVLSFLSSSFEVVYSSAMRVYLLGVLFFSLNRDLRYILPVFFGIILTHITYGSFFLEGLVSKKLKDELKEPAV